MICRAPALNPLRSRVSARCTGDVSHRPSRGLAIDSITRVMAPYVIPEDVRRSSSYRFDRLLRSPVAVASGLYFEPFIYLLRVVSYGVIIGRLVDKIEHRRKTVCT
jgi:hypothetical protein